MTDQPPAPSADEQTNSTRYPIPLKSGEEVRTYIAGGAMKESEFGTWVPLEHHEAELTRLRADRDAARSELQAIDSVLSDVDGAGTYAKAETLEAKYTVLLIDLRALVEQWKGNVCGDGPHDQWPDCGRNQCANELTARLSREP